MESFCVRRGVGLRIAKAEKVLFMGNRYMQKVNLLDYTGKAHVSIVNLHVLKGGNTTTHRQTVEQLQKAQQSVNAATVVKLLIGDANENVDFLKKQFGQQWDVVGVKQNDHDFLAFRRSVMKVDDVPPVEGMLSSDHPCTVTAMLEIPSPPIPQVPQNLYKEITMKSFANRNHNVNLCRREPECNFL